MRPAATSRSTIHLPHISTILFSLSEIWTMTLTASTVEDHQQCCSPTNFFLSFIPATFRRPFHWYINDLYRFRAFGSSPKSCSCLIRTQTKNGFFCAGSSERSCQKKTPPVTVHSSLFSYVRTTSKFVTFIFLFF